MSKYGEIKTDYELNDTVYYYDYGIIYKCFIKSITITITSDDIAVEYYIIAFSSKNITHYVKGEDICSNLEDIIKTIQVK